MPYWIPDILYPLSRWLHIVCTTLIVGGTLFFELVLPIAIEDLKREQQLYVFARARLVFRWVVWIGVVGLLISGGVSMYRIWKPVQLEGFGDILRWAHVGLGLLGMLLGLFLTIGRAPPENPVRWMRFNFMILLVVIFLGSATQHFELRLHEPYQNRPSRGMDGWVPDRARPTTNPGTRPTSQPAP